MVEPCLECGMLTSRVAADGFYFSCDTHPGRPTISVSGIPQGLLTQRELQIVLYTADGYTNQEIAHELGLSYGYVRNISSFAMAKLEVTSRRHFIRKVNQWKVQ